ncbi:hypothetical protein Tbd_1822 [Thiobacillus denitrificans ATCC 25259]|uniref:Uncharacterized protein n=1 Tax=Thiobacillus denitrificans (strain ATCC 25259 / T1) TaxID=292415 RepID=Q3SHV8_THIDA|nr:hypothetical protein Tbd_1822 [Thiobacillus denitrificans ATCC 25259]
MEQQVTCRRCAGHPFFCCQPVKKIELGLTDTQRQMAAHDWPPSAPETDGGTAWAASMVSRSVRLSPERRTASKTRCCSRSRWRFFSSRNARLARSRRSCKMLISVMSLPHQLHIPNMSRARTRFS